MSRVADIAGWCVCMKPSNAWFTRHKPRSSSVIAGMNALPATAFAAAGSWNRSSQADRADGEGTARSWVRRQRAFSERRSARDNKSRSIARRIAAKPLSVSSRSRSSTQSPPARFRKITASTIWISSQPCAPATRTCWRIAVPSPLAWIRSRYSGSPASEVRPPLEVSASYWKPRTPCASIPHLVGDGFGFANGAYLPDSSGPTGNSDYFGAEFRPIPRSHDMSDTTSASGLGPAPIPLRELFPWLLFGALLLLAVYFVGAEEGATSLISGMYVHEFVHDGRHLLGFPAILILIFGGLRAWASSYIRKGVRRSRREWWWLGEGEREKQIVPGGEDQECGDRRQLVEEVVAWSKFCPCCTPKIVANVADGMKCEGEQVQGDQNGREVLFSVAEAVFEVVALVFENVEGFVLDFPPRPAARCEFDDVFAADRQIGDEAVAIGRLALGIADLDLKPVDLERIIAGP